MYSGQIFDYSSQDEVDSDAQGDGKTGTTTASDPAQSVVQNPSAYPLIAEESARYSRELRSLLDTLVLRLEEDEKSVPEEERREVACRRLERLLSSLRGAGVSLGRLRREGATCQRAAYERAVMARVEAFYRENPDVFGELRELRGREAFEAIKTPSRICHVNSLIALVCLLPGGEFSMMAIREYLFLYIVYSYVTFFALFILWETQKFIISCLPCNAQNPLKSTTPPQSPCWAKRRRRGPPRAGRRR